MRRSLNSSKYWTLITDVVLSTVLYYTTKYLAPELAADVKWVIAAYQPVVMMVIKGIYEEDTAKTLAGTDVA